MCWRGWRTGGIPPRSLSPIVLLYVAREGAQRVLRTAFLFAAHGLRLIDRWIRDWRRGRDVAT